MGKKFIITTSEESADLLLKSGFTLVNQSGKQWTFLNDSTLLFSTLEKIAFTNTLNF